MPNPTEIIAIIFDLGGVILRTEDPQPRINLARSLGITRLELENIVFFNPVSQRAERGQASPDEVWISIARTLNLPVDRMPEFKKQFFNGDRVDDHLVEFIKKLRASYTTALLSNTWTVDLERALREDYKIVDAFDMVISSAYHQIVKPEPAIFKLALDLLKTHPEQTVFVDDAEKNITAAAALGIHTIHFRNERQARSDLLAILGKDEQYSL